jgi:hypothetical protein
MLKPPCLDQAFVIIDYNYTGRFRQPFTITQWWPGLASGLQAEAVSAKGAPHPDQTLFPGPLMR